MDCQPVRSCRRWMLPAVALILAFAASGCQKSDQIAHYRVPKEQEVSLPVDAPETAPGNESETAGNNAEPDRMLAAIVSHAQTAWFFKLSGPAGAVGNHVSTFESLIKSVNFPKSAAGNPEWKLPDGWQQKPGSQMRFATLVLPPETWAETAATDASAKPSSSKPLEVSVTSLPWSSNGQAEQLLANVNRWRGQMQLKPLVAAELTNETRSLQLAGEGQATATLVDLTGHLKSGGMQPPFAGGAAANPAQRGNLPPGHPDTSAQLPAGHPSVADAVPSNNRPPMAAASNAEAVNEKGHPSLTAGSLPPAAQDSDLPFTFIPPADWKSAALPTFAVAAFKVSENSPRPEVTVTPLPETPGGIAANVNRWRGQLGLSPASEDELKAQAQPYQVDGNAAHLVRLVGPTGATPQRAITAVVVPHDGMNWIFALKAEAPVAEQQQANFEKFVGSVKFQPSGK